MSEWIEWKGGSQPVSDETQVEVRTRDGSSAKVLADVWYWDHGGDASDIVAYRVVQEAPKADDDWIEWKGGECPFSGTTRVSVRLSNGMHGSGIAADFVWIDDKYRWNVVAYRVVKDATKAEETKVFTAASSESTVAVKPSNPKDIVGVRKAPMSTVSAPVLAEIGVGMLEGAAKYGRHNYRIVGVRSSVYYDATMRHLMSWWEGEDIDPESGMSHITKAITSLVVLRDSQIQGTVTDDRAPRSAEFYPALNKLAGEIIDRHADKSPRHYTIADEVSK